VRAGRINRVDAVPGGLTVTTGDLFSVLSSSLTVTRVNAFCSPFLTTVGLTATYAGTYRLSRNATVNG